MKRKLRSLLSNPVLSSVFSDDNSSSASSRNHCHSASSDNIALASAPQQSAASEKRANACDASASNPEGRGQHENIRLKHSDLKSSSTSDVFADEFDGEASDEDDAFPPLPSADLKSPSNAFSFFSRSNRTSVARREANEMLEHVLALS